MPLKNILIGTIQPYVEQWWRYSTFILLQVVLWHGAFKRIKAISGFVPVFELLVKSFYDIIWNIVFETFNPNILRSVSQMLTAWAEQAEKYRSGEISKEQYDEWRYTYPEKDTTQPWRRFRAQFSLMPYCSAAAYFVSSPSYIRRPMSSRSSKEYFMITSCHRTDSQWLFMRRFEKTFE